MSTLAESYDGLIASDEIIAKVAKISEVAQMARAETRLREYLNAEWNKLASQATTLAASSAELGSTAKQVAVVVDKTMEEWAGTIEETFLDEFERIYKLARTAGHKKANRQSTAPLGYNVPKSEKVEKAVGRIIGEVAPTFDLVDEHAVAALQNHQVFWMGKFYKKGVSAEIAKVARETLIEAGQDSTLAGRLMAEKVASTLRQVRVPTGFNGTTKQYFEAVTANAATTARVHGQLRSFMEIGITKYQIHNPSDHRTCQRCSHMDGKVFTVQQGASQMQQELSASNPDAVKAAHPWPTMTQLTSISPSPGQVSGAAGVADSKALSASGLALPAYHFKCRCTVDVDPSVGSYDQLSPIPPSMIPSPNKSPNKLHWAANLSKTENQAFARWLSHSEELRAIDAERLAATKGNKQTLVDMRAALNRAPTYKGKAHRVLTGLSEESAGKIATKGQVVEQNAMTDWSKSSKSALAALETAPEASSFVIIETATTQGAFDISVLEGAGKNNVILEKNKRLVVDNVKSVTRKVNGVKANGYRIKVKEVETSDKVPSLKPELKTKRKKSKNVNQIKDTNFITVYGKNGSPLSLAN